jgi:hypothetical protein
MDGLEFIAPMIVSVTLIVTTGGVILLRPLSKRLAELLQAMTREKLSPTEEKELAQLRAHSAAMESRLALVEERLAFTEALLEKKRPTAETGALPRGVNSLGA